MTVRPAWDYYRPGEDQDVHIFLHTIVVEIRAARCEPTALSSWTGSIASEVRGQRFGGSVRGYIESSRSLRDFWINWKAVRRCHVTIPKAEVERR